MSKSLQYMQVSYFSLLMRICRQFWWKTWEQRKLYIIKFY